MIQLIEAIYTAIDSDAAKQDYTTCGIKPYKHTDLYYGQPYNPDQFEFVTPALFIDYQINHQQGEITIELHPVDQIQGATEKGNAQRRGMASYIYRNALLRKHLKSFVANGCSRLIEVSERPIVTPEYSYHTLTMRCGITVRSAFDLPLPPAYTDATIEDVIITGQVEK